MEYTGLGKTITIPIPSYEPQPPSPFEHGVAEELKALAEQLESGALHVLHFSLTVTGDKQRLEIETQ